MLYKHNYSLIDYINNVHLSDKMYKFGTSSIPKNENK